MLRTLARKARRVTEIPHKAGAARVLLRELAGAERVSDGAPEDYVHAGYRWLCRAQDVGPDRGVTAYYRLPNGWSASYPETTGYIIPTVLEYGRRFGDEEAPKRALEMADWECDVQLESGAVRSGTMARAPAPAVFNTGQVLFGWSAAYEHAPSEQHAAAARRAAEWMVRGQDGDGAWRRDLSAVVHHPVNTYNARAAWGLAVAGRTFGERAWVEAAVRNGEWVLGQQNAAGWWANNAMDEGPPFLHPIAYVTEGMLELGALAERPDFVECSRRGCDALLGILERDGRIAGRLGPAWEAKAPWRNPTGEAQLALTWLRLFELTGEARYREAARRLNRDVARTVVLDEGLPEIQGAVKGSHPLWGGYHPWGYPNHAVKFLLDSLLLEMRLDAARR